MKSGVTKHPASLMDPSYLTLGQFYQNLSVKLIIFSGRRQILCLHNTCLALKGLILTIQVFNYFVLLHFSISNNPLSSLTPRLSILYTNYVALNNLSKQSSLSYMTLLLKCLCFTFVFLK